MSENMLVNITVTIAGFTSIIHITHYDTKKAQELFITAVALKSFAIQLPENREGKTSQQTRTGLMQFNSFLTSRCGQDYVEHLT